MRRPLDIATVIAFALVALAPTVDLLARPSAARDGHANERRAPAPAPGFPRDWSEVARFPQRFEAHLDDTFGLRDVLLRGRGRLWWFGWRLSPAPTIVRGRDGWAFLAGAHGREDHRGTWPFAPGELEARLAALRARRDLAAAHGAGYLLALCPNKQSLYPERLPATWAPLGQTRMDVFMRAALAEGLPVLDLRPALRAARADDGPDDWLYTALGSHWNGRGGWVAYRAIVERLRADFPALEPLELEDCRRTAALDRSDSLADQLYLEDVLEQVQYALAPEPTREVLVPSKYRQGARLITRAPVAGPRLLWLHDSFGPFLEPLVCETFPAVRAQWQPGFPVEALFEFQPDLVLETYVERSLWETPPMPPDPVTGSPEERFATGTVAWRDPDEDPARALHASEETVLEREDGRPVLLPTVPRQGFHLPLLALPQGATALLRIEADVDATVVLEVATRAPGGPVFLPRDTTRIELTPEQPSRVVVLSDVGEVFEPRVRLLPGTPRLVLTALEVRLCR